MKKTLLVVDDDRAVADSLRKLLEMEGFNVLVGADAAEGVEHFRNHPISLVVLDINLGTGCGWEVFKAMERINPSVPTIVITAEWGQRKRAIAEGVEALIEKPIDVSSFLRLIRGLLAENANHPLVRVHHKPDRCRYFAKDPDTFLRLLQERCSAPLDLSSEMAAALPHSEDQIERRAPGRQTVVGDPGTAGA